MSEKLPGVKAEGATVCTPKSAAPSIEVLSVEPGKTPDLLAVCSVKVGGVRIDQVRVTNRGRGTYINFPSRKVDGEWRDLVTLNSPALRTAVVECILAAVREMDGAR